MSKQHTERAVGIIRSERRLRCPLTPTPPGVTADASIGGHVGESQRNSDFHIGEIEAGQFRAAVVPLFARKQCLSNGFDHTVDFPMNSGEVHCLQASSGTKTGNGFPSVDN